MKNYGSVKIVNITLENASRIEKMVNKAISDLNNQKIKILDLQITEDNIVLVLSKNYWRLPKSKIPERKQTELEEVTKLLEEQNPKDLNEISDLTVKMLKEYKHLLK